MRLKTSATLLTAGEEIDLARRVRGTDPADSVAARNELVLRNLGLVVNAAAYYARRSRVDWDDLFAEGVLALIDASALYDPDTHHTRFSTYAGRTLRNRLRDYLRSSGVMRVPLYLRKSDLPSRQRNRSPRSQERRAACLHAAGRADQPVASLSPETRDQADPRPSPLDQASTADDVRQMLRALGTLPPLRAYLLASRLGLCGTDARTLNSLGSELGLSRERIRQIVVEATAELARKLKSLAPEEII